MDQREALAKHVRRFAGVLTDSELATLFYEMADGNVVDYLTALSNYGNIVGVQRNKPAPPAQAAPPAPPVRPVQAAPPVRPRRTYKDSEPNDKDSGPNE